MENVIDLAPKLHASCSCFSDGTPSPSPVFFVIRYPEHINEPQPLPENPEINNTRLNQCFSIFQSDRLENYEVHLKKEVRKITRGPGSAYACLREKTTNIRLVRNVALGRDRRRRLLRAARGRRRRLPHACSCTRCRGGGQRVVTGGPAQAAVTSGGTLGAVVVGAVAAAGGIVAAIGEDVVGGHAAYRPQVTAQRTYVGRWRQRRLAGP